MSPHPNVRISRSIDGCMIYVNERGGTRGYSIDQWNEYCRMILDFNHTGVKVIQNYEDLPTRTPLHANTPSKPKASSTLDDLA